MCLHTVDSRVRFFSFFNTYFGFALCAETIIVTMMLLGGSRACLDGGRCVAQCATSRNCGRFHIVLGDFFHSII